LITLGLVLEEHGFIKCSRILAGNVCEARTLLDAVAALRKDAGQATLPVMKPTVVVDAGIATEENCAALRQAGFSYLAVSRKKPDAFDPEPLEEIKDGVFVRSFQQGDEVFVYCRSEKKNAKESVIKPYDGSYFLRTDRTDLEARKLLS